MLALLVGEVLAIDETWCIRIARSVSSPTAEQAAQREMQLDSLVVDLDRLDEGVDGLVGLFVEQEIEAGQIGSRQRPRLLHHVLDVDAGGQPAEHEEQRKRQQPPDRIPWSQ